MLIGITGNICSGKSEVARFLQLQGFTQIYLRHSPQETDEIRQTTPATQYPQSGSLNTAIPGSPLNNIEAPEANGTDDGTSNSVKHLIHEMSSLSTEKTSPYGFNQRRSTTFPSYNGHTHEEPMAVWDGPDGEQVIDSDGCEMDLAFDTVAELRDYVTRNWKTNYVTTDVYSLNILETLSGRPFFLHIAIDAPFSVRWNRFTKREALENAAPNNATTQTTLEDFVNMCDEYMYSDNGGVAAVVSRARLTIVNKTQSPELLFLKLSNLNLADPVRLRPSWDSYFMRLANLAALRSNCMKRQVGCVLVRDKRVIATGYNGTPRGLRNCNDGGCERCNDNSNYSGAGLVTCLCLHAEENALLESGRDRIGEGSVIYCNTCPCLTCSIKIVQSGITEVVYLQPYSMDKASEEVLRAGNITLRQFIPPSEGLVM